MLKKMRRIGIAIDMTPMVDVAFLLLIQTGARLSEVLRAKWVDVDLDAGQWTIPSPKAGHKQTVPLAAGTVSISPRRL